MPSRTANRNVRQPDVFRKAAPARRIVAEPGDDAGSRTLRRGLQLLDAVAASGADGLRVVDLCRIAALERATVYRLLATLLECGYVAQRGRFRYVAGLRLASPVPPAGSSNMAVRLQPVLARVSAACGDAAFAVVREGSLSHCIARHVGTHPVQMLVIQVGTRQPLGVGAAGLALLAALPDDEAKAVTAANAPVLAQYGGMTPERMQLLVRATRERGWSVIGNHATQGVLAAGMAVRGADGAAVAGISVASTIERMPRERQQLIARAMRSALAALPPMAQ
ncbi:IclR family transcriptional regulator [Xylophilus sp. ASV27]|uniref:IclR family transcriptional regulator n=1 Tax=Xylophilus sp. ASV27 TaxID=2795129 RepID=UPI0018EC6DD0|nr:IclR family transcriptional regulator C-terminal domain-containing protein [Xylophilus sp. ASV27]